MLRVSCTSWAPATFAWTAGASDRPCRSACCVQDLSIGLLVFGLPSGDLAPSEDFAVGRRTLAESVLRMHGGSIASAVCCTWDRRLSTAAIHEKCATLDLWEPVCDGLAAAGAMSAFEGGAARLVPPQLDAAIALQDCLDEEMGGWANTFG